MGHGCRGKGSDDAVAEIIGTILLVAVAVILAAVISSFAFGMAAGVTRTVAIAVSAHQNGDDIVLTYEGGRDVPVLYRLDITGTEADGTAISDSFADTPPPRRHPDNLRRRQPRQRPRGRRAQLVDGSRHVVLDVSV